MLELNRLAAVTGLIALAALPAAADESGAAKAFEKDREAILAMAGDYKVTFDFQETVALTDGYELKEDKLSGGYEIVRTKYCL